MYRIDFYEQIRPQNKTGFGHHGDGSGFGRFFSESSISTSERNGMEVAEKIIRIKFNL